MYYILELTSVNGDDTLIHMAADGESVDSLFAVICIENGAAIVDNCYRSIVEAQEAWPEAIPPKPYHMTPEGIAANCTINGELVTTNLEGG
jgi:hypothetical protein